MGLEYTISPVNSSGGQIAIVDIVRVSSCCFRAVDVRSSAVFDQLIFVLAKGILELLQVF